MITVAGLAIAIIIIFAIFRKIKFRSKMIKLEKEKEDAMQELRGMLRSAGGLNNLLTDLRSMPQDKRQETLALFQKIKDLTDAIRN
ncbi:MAG: hypothetical protein HQL59_03075 [Magnetococcales bacterium]|nr:hypothetical protein [Magnetococcales bacterium]